MNLDSKRALADEPSLEGVPVVRRQGIRAFLTSVPPYVGPLLVLVLLGIALSVARPFFYTEANLTNLLTTNAPLMIVAVGMTVAMVSGGFDLSVGSTVAATGVAIEMALSRGLPVSLALLAGLGVGLVIGAGVNGILIARFRLNFFVVTLGCMTALGGVVYLLTGGQTRVIDNATIIWFGNGRIAGVGVPILVLVVVIGIVWLFMRRTHMGRNIYAVGGNREAARLAGINVVFVGIAVYAICGVLASIAGIVQVGLLSAAAPTAGTNLALTAGAAVLLGGTSFTGGIGGVTGTVIGVLLIAVLENGLGLFGVSSFWQDVVTGVVLISAVAFDRLQRLGLSAR